jgi:hypothetical protein
MRDETIEALWHRATNEPDRVLTFGRLVAAEAEHRLKALIRALRTHDGDGEREFGLATVKFEIGKPPDWLWATQSDIDDAIDRASLSAAEPAQPRTAEPAAWIQPDHLAKARVAPFLCRVEPSKRADFVPIYTAEPAPAPADEPPPLRDEFHYTASFVRERDAYWIAKLQAERSKP